jgi:hypothetical protein
MPMVSVRQLIGPSDEWHKYFIAHDGHPNALLAGMVAEQLRKTLGP